MVKTRSKMEQRMEAFEREMRATIANLTVAMNEQIQNSIATSMAAYQNRRDPSRGRSRSPHHRSPHHRRSRSPHHHLSRSPHSPEYSRGNSVHSPIPTRRVHTGRKVDLPLFNGVGAYNWLVRMERYFRLNKTEEEDKVEVSMVAMDDRALNWFQWWEQQAEEITWENLKDAVIRRFQPDLLQNPYGAMLSLKQTGTVEDYRDEFEKVIATQKNIDRGMLRGIFINGLKDEIKAELKLFNGKSLAATMDRAQAIEKKNDAIYTKGKTTEKLEGRDKGSMNYRQPVWGEGYKPKAGSSGSQTGGIKNSGQQGTQPWFTPDGKRETEINFPDIRRVGPQLTQEEYQDRSRKGLCFKCGERWGRGHSCKMKNYKLILVEDSDGEEEIVNPEGVIPEEEKITMEFKSMQLSFMNQDGKPSTRAFRVQGILKWAKGEKLVDVLIDSGASHNFISQKVVEQLTLPYQTVAGYQVQLGNGDRVFNKGRCEKLILSLRGAVIQQDFYMLELEGADLVLGMDWLTGLGDVEINFQKQSIKWHHLGISQSIQGDPKSNSMEVSLKTTSQTVQENGVGYLIYWEGRKWDGEGIQLKDSKLEGIEGKRKIDYTVEVDMGVRIRVQTGLFLDPFRAATPHSRTALEPLHEEVGYKEEASSVIPGNFYTQFLPLLAVENVMMKVKEMKLPEQKTKRYWEGRGSRMKRKFKIKVVSYYPP
ncbi:unnamed protein product [Cuscuta europaea]|uniref:Retrotransposon gag domain-containing protein n=1 Tax=Cuscuta europaea TaxID=41803 RepID=A0A9P0VR27_CUSEU|nr:unnamed protein product [Cuscuta europaea]